MEPIKTHLCHGGSLYYYEHAAKSTACTMAFTAFVPPQASEQKCPAVFYLAGLTCTPENFTAKANAYKLAAELGLILIAPDTSPRGQEVADDDSYDLGQGAGFYLNATQSPWAEHFQMERYIAQELYDWVVQFLPIDAERIGIMGHSMGGHGALTLALKYPQRFKSISAFAPICAPTECPWGHKAFAAYLGDDSVEWYHHDASALMSASKLKKRRPILIDQGTEDQFLGEQLMPKTFEEACATVSHPVTLRMQKGYDHSYFFIQTFMDDHLRHHANILMAL